MIWPHECCRHRLRFFPPSHATGSKLGQTALSGSDVFTSWLLTSCLFHAPLKGCFQVEFLSEWMPWKGSNFKWVQSLKINDSIYYEYLSIFGLFHRCQNIVIDFRCWKVKVLSCFISLACVYQSAWDWVLLSLHMMMPMPAELSDSSHRWYSHDVFQETLVSPSTMGDDAGECSWQFIKLTYLGFPGCELLSHGLSLLFPSSNCCSLPWINFLCWVWS